jgi:hypothetical protein
MTIDDRDIQRVLISMADEGYPLGTDVDEAYAQFQGKTSGTQLRRSATRLAVAAGMVGILGVGGLLAYQLRGDDQGNDRLLPATPTTPTTQLVSQQELLGTWAVKADWLNGGFPWLWTFNADGSGTSSPHVDTAQDAWTYTVMGNAINAQDRLGGCQYSWTVERFDAGALDLDVVDHCGNTGPGIDLTRLSPASPAGQSLDMPPMTDATTLRDVADVGGVWLMQGSGMLLAIEADDPAHVTYRLDDNGSLARDPIDRGTVTLDGRGGLSLSSGSGTAGGACTDPNGPGATLKDVVVTDRGFEARQGANSACIDADLTTKWIRVTGP